MGCDGSDPEAPTLSETGMPGSARKGKLTVIGIAVRRNARSCMAFRAGIRSDETAPRGEGCE